MELISGAGRGFAVSFRGVDSSTAKCSISQAETMVRQAILDAAAIELDAGVFGSAEVVGNGARRALVRIDADHARRRRRSPMQ